MDTFARNRSSMRTTGSILCLLLLLWTFYIVFSIANFGHAPSLIIPAMLQDVQGEVRSNVDKLHADVLEIAETEEEAPPIEEGRAIQSADQRLAMTFSNTTEQGILQFAPTMNLWQVLSSGTECDPEIYTKKRCTDFRQAADMTQSKVFITNAKFKYLLNEDINLQIDLYDGYGKPKHAGGDQLRVRMFEEAPLINAGAGCHVIDYQNGSHGAFCKALWPGRPSISVEIRYHKEVAIGIMNNVDKAGAGVRMKFNAIFKAENVEEVTYCSKTPKTFPDRIGVCNFTDLINGVPWYCSKPSHEKLTCSDWEDVEVPLPNSVWKFTDIEKRLLYLTRRTTRQRVIFNVTVSKETLGVVIKPSCRDYKIQNLWKDRSPVGHFYNRKWIPSHCNVQRSPSMLKRCLQGHQVYLFGDSTVKQFVVAFGRLLDCDVPTGLRWTDRVKVPCPGNLSVNYHPHAAARLKSTTLWLMNRPTLASYLEQIPDNTNATLLINFYMHFINKHPLLFIDRLIHMRRNLDTFTKTHPNIKIFIKGPASHMTSQPTTSHKYDYFIPMYKNITRRVFQGLLDKVAFLDVADMTIAVNVEATHPAYDVVDEMVLYMLSFVCR